MFFQKYLTLFFKFQILAMKKLFTLTCLVALLIVAGFSTISFAQSTGNTHRLANTYYWVGGTTLVSFSSVSKWNTQLNGLGASRSVAGALPDDILIVDGSNIGGTTPTTGVVTATVSSNTIGQLKLQNNANLVLQRVVGGGGSGTLTIAGDLTPAPDFVVGAGCSLTCNSPAADGNVNIALDVAATGLVNGTITFTNTGTHRITSQIFEGLVFASGSTFNSDGSGASSYPFGSSSQGVNYGVVFQSGANLVFTGTRSPIGSSSTSQNCEMQTGSNFYVKTSNVIGNGTFTSGKSFGNIYVQNNSTFTCDGAVGKIDNLTIDAGCTMITHTSGTTPLLGNLVVNGTLNAPVASSNQLVMAGSVPQTISGSGVIDMPTFVVANNSDVSLTKTISVSNGASVYGKLTFVGTSQVTGAGSFSSRVANTAVTLTGNTISGSYQITGVVGTISGLTGLVVTGAGISPGTVAIGSSGGNAYINLSQPATATATGVTLDFISDSATLVTSNPNGMDSMMGSVVVTGTKSYQSGTNYIINGATSSPFGINSSATSAAIIGNATLNAPVTTNYNVRVRGVLNLNSGNLTIRPVDTVRIFSGYDLGGAPFSATKYVVTQTGGANVGLLRIDNYSSAKLYPVGSVSNYLPVTLTPTSLTSMSVGVFEDVTSDATPNGAPFTAAQKTNIVDAVWAIHRSSGTGDCNVNVNWTSGLEGSVFSTYTDAEIGLSRHNGTDWGIVYGSGNNTTNNASVTDTSFGAFSVGQLGFILPLEFKNIAASIKANGTEISWNVLNENSIRTYVVERSSNSTDFSAIGSMSMSNKGSYVLLDDNRLTVTVYYRIKIIGVNGSVKYSNVIAVKQGNHIEIGFYPNPVTTTLFINGLPGTSILKVTNTKGEIVLQQITNSNTYGLEVSKLNAGLYSVEIFSGNKRIATKSFIKD